MKVSVLHWSLVQNGVVQREGAIQVLARKNKKLTLGPSGTIELKYTQIRENFPVIQIKNGKVFILLSQIMTGYVHTPFLSGSIDELVVPKGSLAALYSYSHPLEFEFGLDSKASLSLFGFQLLVKFKEEVVRSRPNKQKVTNNQLSYFVGLPESYSKLERSVPLIAGIVAILSFILVFFLASSAKPALSGLSKLPYNLGLDILHAEHHRLLPYIFGPKYDGFSATSKGLVLSRRLWRVGKVSL